MSNRLGPRIGIACHAEFPWQRGVAQLYDLLESQGYHPVLLARRPRRVEASDRGKPYRVEYFPGDESVRLPPPVDRRWTSWLTTVGERRGLSALIVRESLIAPWGVAAARALGIPVALDMRENLAAMYAAGADSRGVLGRLVRSRPIVRRFEANIVPHFDHVFFVSEELKAWACGEYGIAEGRSSVLMNVPSRSYEELAETALVTPRRSDGSTLLIFAGYLRKNRGVQDIVRAIPLLRERGLDVRMRVIGSGDYAEALGRLVGEMDLGSVISLEGMLAASEVPSAFHGADIGLCSYLLSEQTHQTIPGKLFEYMRVGLPVLSSARRSVVRILNETGCGVVYDGRDPGHIADRIQGMMRDRDQLRSMGLRGLEASRSAYSWRANIDVVNLAFSQISVQRPDAR